MIGFKEIKEANAQMVATDIKGKPYMEVNQRIKAFRMVYPIGFITSEILSNEDGVCIFKTEVGYYSETGQKIVLGVGHAYEKENSTFINKTSYIENCETSACGRALGMAGFGIDVSVASYEEVANAIENQTEVKQERKATAKQLEVLSKTYTGENLTKLLQVNGLERLEDMPMKKASDLISKLKGEK